MHASYHEVCVVESCELSTCLFSRHCFFELSARQVASARNAHSCVQRFVLLWYTVFDHAVLYIAPMDWVPHARIALSNARTMLRTHTSLRCTTRHKLARSTRTLPEYVRHDMIQSGNTFVQMTEHIILLRDANTCRTWYTTTTVEASCALSWCSKKVNSLSVQLKYNAVEAWIVLRPRSVGSKAS